MTYEFPEDFDEGNQELLLGNMVIARQQFNDGIIDSDDLTDDDLLSADEAGLPRTELFKLLAAG